MTAQCVAQYACHAADINFNLQNLRDGFLQLTIDGLSWGAIYALVAVGYTLVYGVLKLINFAHAEIFMLGMFGSYFCPLPYQMTTESERRYLAASEAIARHDLNAITTLAEAIAISGLSMSILNGERAGRPVSERISAIAGVAQTRIIAFASATTCRTPR